MEAPRRTALRLVVLCLGGLCALPVSAATFRTRNFVVTAPTDDVAREVAEAAEHFRLELAKEWLGTELPNWSRPCPVKVKVGQIGAGGATTFTFDRGEVSGWDMSVQGTLERILDSVIPHEVSHTILASHFRRPLPRWADEGAATLIEHASERKRQEVMLQRVIHTPQRIPLQRLLTMTEYPSEMQQVYTLYAEGYSLANFLVQHGGDQGKAKFLTFLEDSHSRGWAFAIRKHYGFETIDALEKSWSGWVVAGNPPIRSTDEERLADARPVNNTPATAPAVAPEASRPTVPVATATPATAAMPVSQAVVTPPATPVALAPLRSINRPLRTASLTASLDAPQPGTGSDRIDQSLQAPSADAVALASSDRVMPRRDLPPDFGVPASARLRQIMGQATQQPMGDTVSAARTSTPPAPVARSQSPEKPRRWFSFE